MGSKIPGTRKDQDGSKKLPADLSIEARVVAVDGKPAKQSSVTFWKETTGDDSTKSRPGLMPGEPSHVWRDSTTGRIWRPVRHVAASDRATVEKLSPGRYRITASVGHGNPHDIGVSKIVNLDGNVKKMVVTVPIEKGVPLTVHAVDQKTKKPVEYAAIRLIRSDGLPIVSWSSGTWAVRPRDGIHTFTHLRPGEYTLEVTRTPWSFGLPNYVQEGGPLRLRLEPREKRDLTVKLRNQPLDPEEAARRWPWSVTGTVKTVDGRPVEGATVRAACGCGTLLPTGSATSDAQGRYVLRFGPGMRSWNEKLKRWECSLQAATISVSKPGMFERNLYRQGGLFMATEMPAKSNTWGAAPDEIVLPGKPHRLDFMMKPAASLKGRLLDHQGKPIAEKHFSIRSAKSWPSTSALAGSGTDAKGRFQVDGLPTGHLLWFEFDGARTTKTMVKKPGVQNITLIFTPAIAGKKAMLTISKPAAAATNTDHGP
jgi:hypothetical protein